MVELQIINKILQDKSLDILIKNKLHPEDFLVEGDKVTFILNHYRQYRAVPDLVTFLAEFPDFELFEVAESNEYMVKKLREALLFARVVPILKEAGNKVREDSFDGVDFLKTAVDTLVREMSGGNSMGTDIVAQSRDRLAEYKRRTQLHGLLGITTGIPQLDELLHGWLNEDAALIFARTNEGKSWMLNFFLVAAWNAGKKVLLYSGEMGDLLTGFRFDTLNAHFNNMGLMSGRAELGDAGNEDVGARTVDDYERYINDLSTRSGFVMVTQKDFGGKKPTVDELKAVAIAIGADIIGVDQVSLMSDQRKGKDKRERFTNIAEDLYLMTEDLQKPVLMVGQANRESVKTKKNENDTPELHEIAESDGLPQNATRCISLRVVNKVMRIGIKKNRYGVNNRDVLMLWDTNLGIFKPILENQETAQQAAQEYGF